MIVGTTLHFPANFKDASTSPKPIPRKINCPMFMTLCNSKDRNCKKGSAANQVKIPCQGQGISRNGLNYRHSVITTTRSHGYCTHYRKWQHPTLHIRPLQFRARLPQTKLLGQRNSNLDCCNSSRSWLLLRLQLALPKTKLPLSPAFPAATMPPVAPAWHPARTLSACQPQRIAADQQAGLHWQMPVQQGWRTTG